MEEVDIEIIVKVKGFIKKKIIFEIKHGNETDYAYSIAGLVSTLLNSFDASTTQLYNLLSKIEKEHYRIK